jgi:hypothetical protein
MFRGESVVSGKESAMDAALILQNTLKKRK